MAEYLNLITSVSLSVTLYFGGWYGPGVDKFPLLGILYFAIKAGIFIFIIMWIRFTLPRFRYDQLMKFGWKVLLPFAIINVIVTGTLIMFLNM
jgi:NADH-quinone oxidoreductase subunit H